MSKVAILHHVGCNDGQFSAAVAVLSVIQRTNDVEISLIGLSPSGLVDFLKENIQELTSFDHVYFLDLGFRAEGFRLLYSEFRSADLKMAIIDHHKSTWDNLGELDEKVRKWVNSKLVGSPNGGCGTTFTWTYFGNGRHPELCKLIHARDVFKPEIYGDGYEEHIAWLFYKAIVDNVPPDEANRKISKFVGLKNVVLKPFKDMETIPDLSICMKLLSDDNWIDAAKREGPVIASYKQVEVAKIAKYAIKNELQEKDGFTVMVVNVGVCLWFSDIAKILYDKLHDDGKSAIIVGWSAWEDMVSVSLRSHNSYGKCDELAGKYGGGGHASAAGFKLTKEEFNNWL